MNPVKAIEAAALTATGAAIGAFVGGPIGLGVGMAIGAVCDIFILRSKAVTMPVGGTLGVVPANAPGASANTTAAGNLVTLLQAAATLGPEGKAGPAKYWLQQFQTSIGVPATGVLDPQTRAALVSSVPAAANLPPTTILG